MNLKRFVHYDYAASYLAASYIKHGIELVYDENTNVVCSAHDFVERTVPCNTEMADLSTGRRWISRETTTTRSTYQLEQMVGQTLGELGVQFLPHGHQFRGLPLR